MRIISTVTPSKPLTFPRLVRDPRDGCVMLALKVSEDRGYYGIIMEKGRSHLSNGDIGHFNDDCFSEQYGGSFVISN